MRIYYTLIYNDSLKQIRSSTDMEYNSFLAKALLEARAIVIDFDDMITRSGYMLHT